MRLNSIPQVLRKNLYVIALCLLGVIFVTLSVYLSVNENQTIDEGVHIAAGYSYLKTGDFRMNPEHPPLGKMIAALPLLALNPTLPLEADSWKEGNQWQFAQDFLYHAGNDADTILLTTRLPMILLSVLLGICIVLWSYSLFGKIASLISGALYATAPLFLAHGHLVTTDVPLALGCTAMGYFFYKSITDPSHRWIIGTALAFAFSISVKFSGLIFAPLFLILYLIFAVWMNKTLPHLGWKHIGLHILYATTCSIILVLLITGAQTNSFLNDPFSGTYHIQNLEKLHNDNLVPEGFYQTYKPLTEITYPAYPYIIGLAEFSSHLLGGHDAYFLGEFSKTGFVWYFPVALIIKMRFGLLVLLSLFLTLLVKSWRQRFSHSLHQKVGIFLLCIIPLIILLLSLPSKVNIGVRHVIHAFPFIFIAVGALFSVRYAKEKIVKGILFTIVGITVISGLIFLPFPLAYFSEVIGGPSQGARYLLDSNLDWGQNIKHLNNWLSERNINEVCVAYFGQGNFAYEGIETRFLPNNNEYMNSPSPNCIAVVSAQTIYDTHNTSWSWVTTKPLLGVVGYSFYIYDLRENPS